LEGASPTALEALEPIGTDTPEQAWQAILSERRRWKQVIEAAGIRPEG
jgi:hypothetical protein